MPRPGPRRTPRGLVALALVWAPLASAGAAGTVALQGPESPGRALPHPSLAPFDADVTNIPVADRQPRPAERIDEYRAPIAAEFQGGWMVYQGDLHVHAKGHSGRDRTGAALDTPNTNRDEVNLTGWFFGYDFLAISHHATSWEFYDTTAPLFQRVSGPHARSAQTLLAIKSVENYLGPHDEAHFTAFNKPFLFDDERLSVWHERILDEYSADPLASTHVQLNHPNPVDPVFALPPVTEPERRRRVRDAVELAEYSGWSTYLELLRRGFRVAPVSNSDTHSTFREQEWRARDGAYMDQRPDGRWVKPYVPTPGVPREKWAGTELGGRAGIVLPAATPLSAESFLRALRERRAFRTAIPGAAGFFVANQHVMGSEFALGPGERRLDFTVWASAPQGHGRPREAWTRLEVWTPGNPKPLKVFEYHDPTQARLEQRFSLPPTEGIYVIRLEQARRGAELILAPIWVTNPLPATADQCE